MIWGLLSYSGELSWQRIFIITFVVDQNTLPLPRGVDPPQRGHFITYGSATHEG